MHQEIIQAVCSQYFQVSKEDIQILDRLKGGMSNSNYIVQINDQRYTFRIPGKNASMFVDRHRERTTLDFIESTHLDGNALIHLDEATGYKISHYLEGVSLNLKDPKPMIPMVAPVLRALHSLAPSPTLFYQPYERLEQYEALCHQTGIVHDESYFEIKNKWLQTRSFLAQTPLVFCHNDSQPSNFIDTGEKLLLVDWEFGGNNDPLYDVACYGNFDFQLAIDLLPVYLERTPTKSEWQRLYLWRTFQCLQWHNVALYKEAIGLSQELHLDFAQIARNYITKANTLFEGYLSL